MFSEFRLFEKEFRRLNLIPIHLQFLDLVHLSLNSLLTTKCMSEPEVHRVRFSTAPSTPDTNPSISKYSSISKELYGFEFCQSIHFTTFSISLLKILSCLFIFGQRLDSHKAAELIPTFSICSLILILPLQYKKTYVPFFFNVTLPINFVSKRNYLLSTHVPISKISQYENLN